MDNLDKLKALTNELPGVPKLDDLVSNRDLANHSIIYDVEEGTSFGFGLLNRPEVAVQELFVSKGTLFPDHIHELEQEWGIIYKGKMLVFVDGKDIVVGPGECIHFERGVVHGSKAIEDCWMIAIAIPKITGYPE